MDIDATVTTATIVLADDHPYLRTGVRGFLTSRGLKVIGEAEDGEDAVRLVERFSPDVLVMDISMPRLNGLEATRRITRDHSSTKVIILSMYEDECYALDAFRAGAVGYVLKHAEPEELVRAIRAALEGHRFLSAPLSDRALEVYSFRRTLASTDPYDLLTDRERELFTLIAQGLSYKQICSTLGLSQNTVDYYRKNLMQKLGLHTREEILRYALARDLASPLVLNR